MRLVVRHLLPLLACAALLLLPAKAPADKSHKPPPISLVLYLESQGPAGEPSASLLDLRDRLRSNNRLEVLVFEPDSPTFILAAKSANPPIDLDTVNNADARLTLAQAAGAQFAVMAAPTDIASDNSDIRVFELWPVSRSWTYPNEGSKDASKAIADQVISAAADRVTASAIPAAPAGIAPAPAIVPPIHSTSTAAGGQTAPSTTPSTVPSVAAPAPPASPPAVLSPAPPPASSTPVPALPAPQTPPAAAPAISTTPSSSPGQAPAAPSPSSPAPSVAQGAGNPPVPKTGPPAASRQKHSKKQDDTGVIPEGAAVIVMPSPSSAPPPPANLPSAAASPGGTAPGAPASPAIQPPVQPEPTPPASLPAPVPSSIVQSAPAPQPGSVEPPLATQPDIIASNPHHGKKGGQKGRGRAQEPVEEPLITESPLMAPPEGPSLDQVAQGKITQGDLALQQSDVYGAIEFYREAVDEAPRATTPRMKLIKAYLQAGLKDEALDEERRALMLDPNNQDIQNLLKEQSADGSLPGADLAVREAAVARDPNDESAWIALGDSYWNSGQPDQALQAYTKAAHLAPDDVSAQAHLARLYAATSQYDKSLDALAKAGTAGYPFALRIIAARTDNLVADLESAHESFAKGDTTREEFYESVKKSDAQSEELAAFVAKITPPDEYKVAYLHRRLATNLLAQATTAWLSFIETNDGHYSDQATLLQSEAAQEMKTASIAERLQSSVSAVDH